jgi:hypothetical protein
MSETIVSPWVDRPTQDQWAAMSPRQKDNDDMIEIGRGREKADVVDSLCGLATEQRLAGNFSASIALSNAALLISLGRHYKNPVARWLSRDEG